MYKVTLRYYYYTKRHYEQDNHLGETINYEQIPDCPELLDFTKLQDAGFSGRDVICETSFTIILISKN